MNWRSPVLTPFYWAVAIVVWIAVAALLYGSPGFGANRSQPVWVLAAATVVVCYALRSRRGAWPVAIFATPLTALAVLYLIAKVGPW